MSQSDLLKGKTALITGSNRGIGKTLVEIFASNGASIIACARKDSEDFAAFRNEVSETYKVQVKSMFFDLTNEQEIKEAFKTLFLEKPTIDILINNAGVAHGGLLHMTSIDKMREVFEINFFSQILITQYVTKLMFKQKRGSVVNISSVAGIDAYSGYIAYGSSKAALIYATKTLAKEFAPHNVRVNAIAPGLTETDMAGQMEEKAKNLMVSDSAMQRLATPFEVANAALFLASDLSSFINGQVLRVDGGM